MEQMGRSCSVVADDAVGAPDARSGEFDHGGFRRRETLDLLQVRKVGAGVGWQCWSVDLFGVMDDVHSSLTGGAHPGGCGRGTPSRDHGLHTVVLTIDGAVDDMDVFDVATALTGDERELWTVDDAGGLGSARGRGCTGRRWTS